MSESLALAILSIVGNSITVLVIKIITMILIGNDFEAVVDWLVHVEGLAFAVFEVDIAGDVLAAVFVAAWTAEAAEGELEGGDRGQGCGGQKGDGEALHGVGLGLVCEKRLDDDDDSDER